MKKIKAILILLVLVSCNKNQNQTKKIDSEEIQNKEELSKYDLVEEKEDKDTKKNYWNIDLDTIKSSQIIHSNKEDFELKVYN